MLNYELPITNYELRRPPNQTVPRAHAARPLPSFPHTVIPAKAGIHPPASPGGPCRPRPVIPAPESRTPATHPASVHPATSSGRTDAASAELPGYVWLSLPHTVIPAPAGIQNSGVIPAPHTVIPAKAGIHTPADAGILMQNGGNGWRGSRSSCDKLRMNGGLSANAHENHHPRPTASVIPAPAGIQHPGGPPRIRSSCDQLRTNGCCVC